MADLDDAHELAARLTEGSPVEDVLDATLAFRDAAWGDGRRLSPGTIAWFMGDFLPRWLRAQGRPHYLNEEERAGLLKGERVLIGREPFVVVSGPSDRFHPVLMPPPEQVFIEPPMERMYLDRRGRS